MRLSSSPRYRTTDKASYPDFTVHNSVQFSSVKRNEFYKYSGRTSRANYDNNDYYEDDDDINNIAIPNSHNLRGTITGKLQMHTELKEEFIRL
jgi:hypothetical protein